MISDRFSNCARPEIQEDVVFRGQKVRVAKEWKDYTNQEKANAINYKFGCGIDIVVFILELEHEFEAIKAKINAAADEVEKRITPEYLARLENSLFERIDQVEAEIKNELARCVTYASLDLATRVKELEAEIEYRGGMKHRDPDGRITFDKETI